MSWAGSRVLPAEAAQPVLDVGGVAHLAQLAVADDIEADRHLAPDHVGHRRANHGIGVLRVYMLPGLTGKDHVNDRLRPGQAADVGGEYAIGAGFHEQGREPRRKCQLLHYTGTLDQRSGACRTRLPTAAPCTETHPLTSGYIAMRCCSLLIALLVALPASGQTAIPTGKLGSNVSPLAYRLELEVLPDQKEFSGTTEIDIEVAAPTPVIYLHGNGLVVTSATYTSAVGASQNGARQAGRYKQLDPTGVAALDFATPVPAGRGTLHIQYSAPLGKVGEGLYRSDVAGESYAFTQFQPIDARRMFPGFDEPGYKTPFDIAVTTHAANVVIGNTPIRSEQPTGAGLKRVDFMTTLPLPTYLIALAVGPLDVVDGPAIPPNAIRDRPLPLRGVATRGKGPKLKYALDNTAAIVNYLEAYFDVPFPYPKLDLIASPEAGGGMENAGAIFYGDTRLLLDDHRVPARAPRLWRDSCP